VMYLIFFGSLAGYSAYVWLLQVRPVTQVSTYAYVNPVVAVLLGVLFAGEHMSLLQIGGLAVILTSVLLINLAKYRKQKPEQKNQPARSTNRVLIVPKPKAEV
jgi:drug/metabolite transporter (DMT)-like permease